MASAGMSLAPACVPAMAGAESAEATGAVLFGPATSGDAATTSASAAVGRFQPGRQAAAPAFASLPSSGTTAGSRVVMGATMAFRLVMML